MASVPTKIYPNQGLQNKTKLGVFKSSLAETHPFLHFQE